MNQEFANVSSGKPERGMLWIVGTIWANIIIVALIAILPILFLSSLLEGLINPVLVSVLNLLLFWGVAIFAIKLGVKSVLAKSIVKKEKILEISILTGFIFFLLSAILLLPSLLNMGLMLYLLIASALISAIIYVGITYFWCKRLVK